MKPSLQKLQKIFKLEADRSYDNHAVLGGLERMLDHWVPEARAEDIPEDLIQAVIHRLHNYERLAPKSRAETLEGIWRRVQRSMSSDQTAGTPPSPAARPPKTPSGTPPRADSKRAPEAAPQYPVLEAETPAPETPAPEPAAPAEGDSSSSDTIPAVASKTDLQEDRQVKTDDEIATGAKSEPAKIEYAKSSEKPIQDRLKRAAQRHVPPEELINLDAPITILSGIGEKYAQSLSRLGINTLGEMLYYFPRRYDDYSALKPINRLAYQEQTTVIGTIQSISTRMARGGALQIIEAIITDGSGSLRVNWYNQPHIIKRLHPGMQISLAGKVEQFLGRAVMNNPSWEPLEQQQLTTNRIVPVYHLTAGVHQNWLRRVINQAVLAYAPRVQDPLPISILEKASLVDLPEALIQIHYPETVQDLEAAQDRLSFDEIFLLQLGVLQQKQSWQDRSARVFTVGDSWLEAQLNRLPYPLTNAQQKVLGEIRQDLSTGKPMNRLVQGDVGSGKTVVAALGMSLVLQAGAQAAIMAPTSILAEQHYKSLLNLLSSANHETGETDDEAAPVTPALLFPEQIRLLVGATPEAEKGEIRSGIQDGSIKLLIGTHALIEDPIQFADLQLVVIDEQHRFGVDQRSALRQKGENTHLLVMTATPIPRTLALSIYGDLDLSIIDEMPAGRIPVATFVLYPRERERAYSLIRSQVESGRQAFVIYPLVEESETSQSGAAVEEFERLRKEIFPEFNVALLHGRMKPDEKDEVMEKFRDRQSQILVSTTVVEVGVDIPNASIMLIEGANRFGLAQLHQLRGRVGRGSEKSYCLLIPDTPDDVENERLRAMIETNDGFVLAERDLALRGPGQFLGTRQSGYTEFQLANLSKISLIEKARNLAQGIFAEDSKLETEEHKLLAQSLHKAWAPHHRGDIS